MSKLTKILLSLTTIFFILTFSACSTEEIIKEDKSTKNNIGVSGNAVSIDSTGKYKVSLGNNIEVDAVIDKPNINNAAVLQVEDAVFDEKKLCDIFLGSDEVKKEKLAENTIYSIANKTLEFYLAGSFRFRTPLSEYINDIIDTWLNGNDNGDKFRVQDLSFMTREKAIEEARKVLMKLNITPYGSPTVYALDNKTIKQEQERLLREDRGFKDFVDMGKIKLKDNWSSEDDSYYMIFRNDIEGISCDSIGYTVANADTSAYGSDIRMIISKNGIEYFFIDGKIYRKKSVKGSKAPLISISQALNSVERKYSNVILSDKIMVSGISLVYLPVLTNSKGENLNTELVPTWLFNVNQKIKKGNNVSEAHTNIRINALDGKEIR